MNTYCNINQSRKNEELGTDHLLAIFLTFTKFFKDWIKPTWTIRQLHFKQILGIEDIYLRSSTTSCQTRKRQYFITWLNAAIGIENPKDECIVSIFHSNHKQHTCRNRYSLSNTRKSVLHDMTERINRNRKPKRWMNCIEIPFES